MPSKINQTSYIDSYTHDNGSSYVDVRDFSNDDSYLDPKPSQKRNNMRSSSMNFDDGDNRNRNVMNTNEQDYYVSNNNRNMSRNVSSRTNVNDEQDYNMNNNRNMARNSIKPHINMNDENFNNSRNTPKNSIMRSNFNNFEDEDFSVTPNRSTVRNTRPADTSYAGPSVINSLDNGPNQNVRRNSTTSFNSGAISLTQSNQPINYEEFMYQIQQVMDQEREIMQKKMDEFYPVTFIVTYSFIFIVICLTIIALQITMIVYNVTLANIGSGSFIDNKILI